MSIVFKLSLKIKWKVGVNVNKLKGENLSIVRNINQSLIINYLREQDYSVTDLAQKLGLSNTAITKIINELIDFGLVSEAERVVSKVVGRRKVNYHFNESFGVVAVVNLAQKELLVTNMHGTIIKQQGLKSTKKINQSYLKEVIQELITLVGDLPLLAVTIITIGKINPNTNEFIYALNIEDYQDIHLQQLFQDAFQVPINIRNDIFLGLIGELKKGILSSGVENGIYIYNDQSIASSLLLNGQLFEGSRGFAGEMGLFSTESGKRLEEVVSCTALLNQVRELGMDVDFNQLVELYQSKDESVNHIITQSAICLARYIKNIIELLDLEVVVLSGAICELGPRYLNEIKAYMEEFHYLDVKVVYSEMGNQAILMGAIDEAIVAGIAQVVNKDEDLR
jgi:predicted NBD/HSP70 family sugar kinase